MVAFSPFRESTTSLVNGLSVTLLLCDRTPHRTAVALQCDVLVLRLTRKVLCYCPPEQSRPTSYALHKTMMARSKALTCLTHVETISGPPLIPSLTSCH